MSQNNKANFSNFTLQLFFNFFNSPHDIQSIKVFTALLEK